MFFADRSRCVNCGLCESICPADLIVKGEDGYPEMFPQHAMRCIECGHCVLFCPKEAASLSFMKNTSLVKSDSLTVPTQLEFLNMIKTRRSVRYYEDKPVSRDLTLKLISESLSAPSACNIQPVRWIISESRAKTKEVLDLMLCWLREEIFKDPTSRTSIIGASLLAKAKTGVDAIFRGAPNIVVATVPKDHVCIEDGAIALTYFELLCHSYGLGSCWAGYFTRALRASDELQNFLQISDKEHVCGTLMFGYPSLKPVRHFAPRREAKITWL
ncbi:MAG: nitroreductase family protein [Synergistaceae bacterium]